MDPQSRPEAAETAASAEAENLAERLAAADLRLAAAMSLSAAKKCEDGILADVWDDLADVDRFRVFTWIVRELASRCSTAQVDRTLGDAALEAHFTLPDPTEQARIEAEALEQDIWE